MRLWKEPTPYELPGVGREWRQEWSWMPSVYSIQAERTQLCQISQIKELEVSIEQRIYQTKVTAKLVWSLLNAIVNGCNFSHHLLFGQEPGAKARSFFSSKNLMSLINGCKMDWMKWLLLQCLAYPISYFIFLRIVEGGKPYKFPKPWKPGYLDWPCLLLCPIPQHHIVP